MNKALQMFAKEFGRLLLPEGFFLWKDSFYRIRNEMMWLVRLQKPDENSPCIVNYDIKTFCHGMDDNEIVRCFYQVHGLWSYCADQIDKSQLYKDEYEIRTHALVFRNVLLERFTSVQSIEDMQEFRSWNYEMLGGKRENRPQFMVETWEHIHSRNYHLAIEMLDTFLENRKKANRQQLAFNMKSENGLEDLIELKQLLINSDDAALQLCLEQRKEKSRLFCERFFMRSFE